MRAAVLLVVALALTGCSGAATGTRRPPVSTTASASQSGPAADGAAADPAEVARALNGLLRRRENAVLGGDSEAYLATVDRPTAAAGVRQLAAFRSARALGLARLVHGPVPDVADPAAGVVVELGYRVEGVDRADRTSTVRYRLARSDGGWRVSAEDPEGSSAAAPWLAMPGMRVERGERAVVAGTAGDAALAEAVATVDRVLPTLGAPWPGTPRRVLVLVPRTEAQAAALLGRGRAGGGEVAATTEGPLDAAGLATGDRVVLDADAGRRLTPTGREVVLAHELTHVAVRATLAGSAPAWLAEGYADHVGYARAHLPARELAAPLVRAVRAGRGPTALPTAADLDPAGGDIEVGYLAAWQAVELVAQERGESAVRALVRACTVPGPASAAETACDRAMPGVIGRTRSDLTREWRQRLAALAR
ncbi:MAG TPA: DUF4157 domain-containing protein [Phycicoccus sp.]|nr:DUF4157 domain-containing protein [Phycicoccus sp.]